MSAEHEASYCCPECGEEILVPVDLHGGAHQEYVEDCPVCCHPNVLRVAVDSEGEVRIDATAE